MTSMRFLSYTQTLFLLKGLCMRWYSQLDAMLEAELGEGIGVTVVCFSIQDFITGFYTLESDWET